MHLGAPQQQPANSSKEEKKLGLFKMFCMTFLCFGVQLTCFIIFLILGSVELGYGNPFLLSLGCPKPLLSLVWLAGPLSGFL
jgi:solute carrier family 45 protein 1/2/4